MSENTLLPRPLTNLADPRFGASVVAASDEFFGDKSRLIDPKDPVYIPDKYDAHGKWMDGWETRRRRDPGHDHCIIRLGRPGVIHGFEVDTRHFTGGHPASASVEACSSDKRLPGKSVKWAELTPALGLKGNDRQWIKVDDDRVWTHVRLNIYPDGGVARLRVLGRVEAPRIIEKGRQHPDLAAIENGGRALASNDEHFGPLSSILMPGRPKTAGDGWETRRRRDPGYDWGIIELGCLGHIEEILIDTAHYTGNFPEKCFLQASDTVTGDINSLIAQSQFWPVLLPEQPLEMDREHSFTNEIYDHDGVRFARINIIPDGGIARVRLFGQPI